MRNLEKHPPRNSFVTTNLASKIGGVEVGVPPCKQAFRKNAKRAAHPARMAGKKPPATLSFYWSSCANVGQNTPASLENPDSAPTLVKSTNLLVFCTCIHRFSGRTVALTDEPCRASGVGCRNGWWNEKPMRIGKSPPAQPEGETWGESPRGIAGRARHYKSRRKSEVVKLADPEGARTGGNGILIDGSAGDARFS